MGKRKGASSACGVNGLLLAESQQFFFYYCKMNLDSLGVSLFFMVLLSATMLEIYLDLRAVFLDR